MRTILVIGIIAGIVLIGAAIGLNLKQQLSKHSKRTAVLSAEVLK